VKYNEYMYVAVSEMNAVENRRIDSNTAKICI